MSVGVRLGAVWQVRPRLDLLGWVTSGLILKHAHPHATATTGEGPRIDLEAAPDPNEATPLRQRATNAALELVASKSPGLGAPPFELEPSRAPKAGWRSV